MDAREFSEWLAYYRLESDERGHAPSSKKQGEREMREVLLGLNPKVKGR